MSFSSVTILSPAKVNLALHVTGQDPKTGYHLLDSVVCFPNWGDFLTFSPAEDMQLTVKGASKNVPVNENNLIYKAYKALTDYIGSDIPKTHITLTKNIPMQAGLGGGSSNAATCLLIWKKLFLPDLKISDLHKVAQKVGADVAICLYRKPCLMKSFGEDITLLPQTGMQYHMLLVKPTKGADTENIFTHLKNKNNSSLSQDIADTMLMQHALQYGRNDLAPIAIENTPEIQDIHNIISEYAPIKYNVTGSGSASFALFYDSDIMQHAASALESKIPNLFTAQTKVIL